MAPSSQESEPPENPGRFKVEQGEIVGRLLGPADQDRAEAVEPRVGALHDPAPRLATGVTLGPGFLAPAAQVKREAEFRGQGARLLVVEALRAYPSRQGGWP